MGKKYPSIETILPPLHVRIRRDQTISGWSIALYRGDDEVLGAADGRTIHEAFKAMDAQMVPTFHAECTACSARHNPIQGEGEKINHEGLCFACYCDAQEKSQLVDLNKVPRDLLAVTAAADSVSRTEPDDATLDAWGATLNKWYNLTPSRREMRDAYMDKFHDRIAEPADEEDEPEWYPAIFMMNDDATWSHDLDTADRETLAHHILEIRKGGE